jgi:DNA-binding MarR family transcriptional regulator
MYTNGGDGGKLAGRGERGREPGLGILAAQLLAAVESELYRRLAAAGYDDLRPSHGLVLAYLDVAGSRATELAARSGRHKQLVGRTIDELEALGYVERAPDPADRRAKLVVPTPRGHAVMRLSDQIMGDIGRRVERAVGSTAYGEFRRTLKRLVADLRDDQPQPPRRP